MAKIPLQAVMDCTMLLTENDDRPNHDGGGRVPITPPTPLLEVGVGVGGVCQHPTAVRSSTALVTVAWAMTLSDNRSMIVVAFPVVTPST